MQRISTLEPEITNGYLLFSESINPRLITQLTLFPTTHDDGPDALQGAVAQLKKPVWEPDIGVGLLQVPYNHLITIKCWLWNERRAGLFFPVHSSPNPRPGFYKYPRFLSLPHIPA